MDGLRAIDAVARRLSGRAAAEEMHLTPSAVSRPIEALASELGATLWLLPRLAGFQQQHPDFDIRIAATDHRVDMDDPEIDLALRTQAAAVVPPWCRPKPNACSATS